MEEDLSLDNICKQYYQTIYRYCLFKTNHNTHLADDITSDVFYLLIQKWENLSSLTQISCLKILILIILNPK